jgi:hypothetical protein
MPWQECSKMDERKRLGKHTLSIFVDCDEELDVADALAGLGGIRSFDGGVRPGRAVRGYGEDA